MVVKIKGLLTKRKLEKIKSAFADELIKARKELIEVHVGGSPALLNRSHIYSICKDGKRTRIISSCNGYFSVDETYDEIKTLLGG